jgi:hypothetical protein
MPIQIPALPDYTIKQQPAPDLLKMYGEMATLRQMNQLQPLDIQERQQRVQAQTQENQLRQIQLQDQNGLHQAMIDSGGDPDKLRTAMADPKYGISPNGQFGTVKMLNEYKQSQIALDQATRKDNIDSDSAIADRYQKIALLPKDQQPSAVNDLKGDTDFLKGLTPRGRQEITNFQYGGPDSVTMMAHSHLTRQALDEQADKEAAAAKSQAQANQANANTAKITGEQDPNSPMFDPSAAYLAKRAAAGDPEAKSILAQQAQQAGAKAGAEAKAKLPYEMQLKQEELAQNPVFAVNPKTGQRELTTVADAKANGYTNPTKVTQSDIEKESQLTSQVNDMQLNQSRYRAALNAMGDLSAADRTAITHILSDPSMNNLLLQGAGFPAVVSMAEQSGKGRDWNALSPDKQDALIGYLRMKNTGLLAQKVLTGMGRASKEALDIELANMPSPIEGATVGNKKLDAWQQNIDQMASRTVKLPWMEGSQDVRARIEGQATDQYNKTRQTSQPTGRYKPSSGRTPAVGELIPFKGSSLKVSQVFPDGSFNAQ